MQLNVSVYENVDIIYFTLLYLLDIVNVWILLYSVIVPWLPESMITQW